jgi:hypothetical protein
MGLDALKQNLLYVGKPEIEVIEMTCDHRIVHQPLLPENEGGDRTAILASSEHSNACAGRGHSTDG